MAKERLVGSDGKLVVVSLGAEISTITAEGWYEVTATGTGIPAGLVVGDLFWDDGDITISGTARVKLLTEAEQADVTSFNLEISKAEIDVTTLGDGVRRYRTGKIDMTGSLEGITTLGETDAEGWVLNNFMRIIDQATDGTVDVYDIDDSPIYLKGVLQKDLTGGEQEAFFWAKVNLLGTSLGAQGEDAQGFSSNFRIAPGDPEPTFYVRDIAVPST